MGHVSPTTPLLGDFVIHLTRLDIVSQWTKFDNFTFTHSWDINVAYKSKTVQDRRTISFY